MKKREFQMFLVAIGLSIAVSISCTLPFLSNDSQQDKPVEENNGIVQQYQLPGTELAVSYQVSEEGEALFWIEDMPDLEPLSSSIVSGEEAVITWQGVSIDGYGALDQSESQKLNELFSTLYAQAVPLIALQNGCGEESGLSAKQVAALLYPWQVHLKYSSIDRMEEIQRFLIDSNCAQIINQTGLNGNNENSPFLEVSADAPFPVVMGYFPFDPEGAFELEGVSTRSCVLAKPISPEAEHNWDDSLQVSSDIPFNVIGPCGSKCRGACGIDCPTNNCKVEETFRCIKDNDGNLTGYGYPVLRYTCGVHEGCIEHDACYDSCNRGYGCSSFWAAWCRHGVRQGNCDGNSFAKYGTSQSAAWARGKGVFTGTMVFDYTVDPNQESVEDLEACPAEREPDITKVTPVQFTISGEFEETLFDEAFPIDPHLCKPGKGRFSFTLWNVGALAGEEYASVTVTNTSTPYFEYYLAEWEGETEDRCVTYDYANDYSGSDFRFSGGPNGVVTSGDTVIGTLYNGTSFQFFNVGLSPRTFSVSGSSVFSAWE